MEHRFADGKLSTLCYLERDESYLMLYRNKKKNDVNEGKWIGLGGHFEENESPEDCVLREVWEESGYRLTDYRFRGIVTFISGTGVTEYMSLFTATGFIGEEKQCTEGDMHWIKKRDIEKLSLWEGDKIFLRLLMEEQPFFSLKLVYDGHDGLKEAVLNGKPLDI